MKQHSNLKSVILLVLTVLGIIAILPLAFAQECTGDSLAACEDLSIMDNKNVPGIIPYSNEIIQVKFDDNTSIATITIEDKIVTERTCCTVADAPTLHAWIDEKATIDAILASENSLDAGLQAKSDGKIRIEPVTFGGQIKWVAMSLSISAIQLTKSFFSLFSSGESNYNEVNDSTM